MGPRITSVVLYSTPECWRFSFLDERPAMICGTVDAPAGAPFELADGRLRELLSEVTGQELALEWVQDRPGWYSAEISAPPTG